MKTEFEHKFFLPSSIGPDKQKHALEGAVAVLKQCKKYYENGLPTDDPSMPFPDLGLLNCDNLEKHLALLNK